MLADSSTEMVEQSMQIFGDLPPESTPSLPKYTCSRSLPSDTIENTTSHEARSASLSTILPPFAASGSAFARVRFQTLTSWPALSRRSAMGRPMRPVPIQPIFCAFFDITKLSHCNPVVVQTPCDGLYPFCRHCASGGVPQQSACPLCLSRLFKAHYSVAEACYKTAKEPSSKGLGPWEDVGTRCR